MASNWQKKGLGSITPSSSPTPFHRSSNRRVTGVTPGHPALRHAFTFPRMTSTAPNGTNSPSPRLLVLNLV